MELGSIERASKNTPIQGASADMTKRALVLIRDYVKEFNLPVLTDVHEDTPIQEVADVVDVFQTPAFLCRQTNFIQRVASYDISSTLGHQDLQLRVDTSKDSVSGTNILILMCFRKKIKQFIVTGPMFIPQR